MRQIFVRKHAWLDEAQFAQLLAICQFLPGPASSQLGFSIGLIRGGWLGALAAFAAFTLPSVALMFLLVALLPALTDGSGTALLHGLKLVAVVVVAHGLIGMIRQLTPDLPRALIAVAAAALLVLSANAWMQLVAIGSGAILGRIFCRAGDTPAPLHFSLPYSIRGSTVFFGVFATGLALAVWLGSSQGPTLFGVTAAFYRAGALVFGGGHVVLPLLQSTVVDRGWLSQETFLAGYGAAQAMPGPMFSMAAFLGAEVPTGVPPWVSGLAAIAGIFLPGFLLLLAALPFWVGVSRHPAASRSIAGINASVVGLLGAAFVNPVASQGLNSGSDLAIALVGLALIAGFRLHPLWVVLWCVGSRFALSLP